MNIRRGMIEFMGGYVPRCTLPHSLIPDVLSISDPAWEEFNICIPSSILKHSPVDG
jgi:hypothetical protein